MFVLRRVTVRIASTINLRSLYVTVLKSTDQLEKYDVAFGSNHDFTGVRKEERKSLRIAILGAPNAGKSTLINQLVDHQVCAASAKQHTTRVACRAIAHVDDTELVFVDTPGIVFNHEVRRHGLEKSFQDHPKLSLKHADVVGVLHDVSQFRTRRYLHSQVLRLIKNVETNVPALLLLNKVDKMARKQQLLDLVKKLTGEKGWPHFVDVFMLSALNGDGVQDLKDYLVYSAKSREWEYPKEILTDQKPEDMVVRLVQGKLLDALPSEIPYNLDIQMEYFNKCNDGSISSFVLVECPTERLYKLVLRKLTPQLKEMMQGVEQILTKNLQQVVRLRLVIQPKQTNPNEKGVNRDK